MGATNRTTRKVGGSNNFEQVIKGGGANKFRLFLSSYVLILISGSDGRRQKVLDISLGGRNYLDIDIFGFLRGQIVV